MAIKQLDPRMINPGEKFTNTDNTFISNLTSDNVVATNITLPGGNSNTWNNVSTVVQTNSALWEETADIVPTVTSYLSSSIVVLSSLNVTNYQVSSVTVSNIEFTNADSGKTFHLNTTTTPSVTAQFPGNLSDGFNVSIINAGLGSIFLSAGSPLNASGSENSTPFSGMFIYKTNNELFGVGVFV